MRRAARALVVGVLSACASAPPPTVGSGSAPSPEQPKSRLLRPDQIFEILQASAIDYDIVSTDHVDGVVVPQMVDRPLRRTMPVDPFIELRRDGEDGALHIVKSEPPEAIAEVFQAAGHAFEANDYEVAQALYAKAIAIEPTYFKSYTYFGNTLLNLGEYHRAQEVFLKALIMNPVDYQAMIFLGDALYNLGEYGRAKTVLTRAFMLNRNNPAVVDRLQAVLGKLNLRIRNERLSPSVLIEQIAKDKVQIHVDKVTGSRWIAMAACMACWAFEDRCNQRATEEEDPLRLSMYRECLINQAASISVRREHDEEPIHGDERILLQAIEDGFLDAIIFWEIVAHTAPVVILILPDPLQDLILDYIERYVYVSTQVV